MPHETFVLTATAVSIGVLHTLFGPDHYVPFVAMAKARRWSLLKTLRITAWCGAGHVAGSLLLGLLGLLLGTLLEQLEAFEAVRGHWAAWSLVVFGGGYLLWGVLWAYRPPEHDPAPPHHDSAIPQAPPHQHGWIVFSLTLIFVLGPCEALIPLLLYPAAAAAHGLERLLSITLVVTAFSLATIATMTLCTACLYLGLRGPQLDWLHRFQHALAGLTVLLCGVAVLRGA